MTLVLLVYTVSVLAYLKLLIRDRQYTFAKDALGLGALAFTAWALWAANFKMVRLSLLILVIGVPMRLWMVRAQLRNHQKEIRSQNI